MKHLTPTAVKRIRKFIDLNIRHDMGSPHFHLWQAVEFIEQRFSGGDTEPRYEIIAKFNPRSEDVFLDFSEKDFI